MGPAMEWVCADQPWVAVWVSASGRPALPLPCRASPGDLKIPKPSQTIKKKKCFPQIRNLTWFSVLIGTRVFSKVTLYYPVLISDSTHLRFMCMQLHASAMRFLMTRKGLSQGAGGKQPAAKSIKQMVGEPSLKGKEASRQIRRGAGEEDMSLEGGVPGPPWGGGSIRLLPWVGQVSPESSHEALICGHTRVGMLFGELTCLQVLVQLGFSSSQLLQNFARGMLYLVGTITLFTDWFLKVLRGLLPVKMGTECLDTSLKIESC